MLHLFPSGVSFLEPPKHLQVHHPLHREAPLLQLSTVNYIKKMVALAKVDDKGTIIMHQHSPGFKPYQLRCKQIALPLE